VRVRDERTGSTKVTGKPKGLSEDITPPPSAGINSANALTSLARLAVDSGGEFTERTNELVRGVASARRDLSCVYSLGFYDDDADEGRIREVTVHVRRPGVKTAYPVKLIHRTPAARRESQIRGGFLSDPSGSNHLRARVYPLRPLSGEAWEGVVAVSFEVSLDGSPGEILDRDFGGVLHSGSRVAHQFDRRITLKLPTAGHERRVTFIEPAHFGPGSHTLSVVLSDPVSRVDLQVSVDVDVPEVPKDRLFVVGPILGRRSGADLMLTSGGQDYGGDVVGRQSTFQPLVSERIDGTEDLFALTQICMVRSKKKRAEETDGSIPMVHRVLLAGDGEVLGRLAKVPLALEGDGRIRCQNLLDLLPTSVLDAGEYALRAFVVPTHDDDGGAAEVSFRIGTDQPRARPSRDRQ